MTAEAEAEGSVTAILKRADPLWWWLRENFKLPSIAAIAGIIAGGGAWLWSQHQAIIALQARPDLSAQMAGLATRLDQDERADLAAGYERRISAMEAEWRKVHEAADRRYPPKRPGR